MAIRAVPLNSRSPLEKQRNVEGGPPGKHAGREQERIAGGQGDPQVGGQTDRHFVLAEELGRQPDGPGDHRRVILIPQGQVAAPLPVVGLVRHQQELAADRNPHGKSRKKHDPGGFLGL